VTEQVQPSKELLAPGKYSWLQRPSLAYHVAFDLCAAQAARAGGPTAVLASSRVYGRELVHLLNEIHMGVISGTAAGQAGRP